MKNNILMIFALCLILIPNFSIGQLTVVDDQKLEQKSDSYKLEFTDVTYAKDANTVRFFISGIKDELHKKQVYLSLTEFNKIKSVEIDNDNLCIASIEKDVIPEDILKILNTNSTDFQYKKVVKKYISKTASQIQPFAFEGVKDYENNRRIAYFTVNGLQSQKQAIIIKEAMSDIDGVYRFQFFDKNAYNKFMIECDPSYNEKHILDKMNEILKRESGN